MLYSLQIGRAIAALAVVMHHSIVSVHMNITPLSPALLTLLNPGYLGVDYFFVLSGFLIAHVTMGQQGNTADAKHYAFSRAIRIYVPYLPVSIGMIAMLMLMHSFSFGSSPDDYSFAASLFLVPANAMPALSVAWTLQHEVLFYVLFGLCFLLFKDRRLIFLWALPIIALLFFHVTNRAWNVVAGFINLEFLFGVAACYAYHSGKFFAARYALLMVGFLLVLATIVLLYHGATMYYFRLLAGLGFSAIVLALALMERHMDFSRFRTAIFLGAASYAIYLVHAPFLSVLSKLPLHYPHWLVAFGIFMMLSCVAGAVYFWLIERPLIRFAHQRLLGEQRA